MTSSSESTLMPAGSALRFVNVFGGYCAPAVLATSIMILITLLICSLLRQRLAPVKVVLSACSLHPGQHESSPTLSAKDQQSRRAKPIVPGTATVYFAARLVVRSN